MKADHNQTFKIDLKGIVLIDDDSRFLEISNIVDTFSIDYSLFSKSISATFQITDFDSILSDWQINGNENIAISFKTPDLTLGKYDKFKDDIKLLFRVLSVKDREITAARASTYLLHCVSLEYINNERLSVQRSYSDLDGSEIVRDIYHKFLKPEPSEYGPEDNGNPLLTKKLNFTKTGNTIYRNFTTEKPLDAIYEICKESEYTERDTSAPKNPTGTKKDPSNELSTTVKEQVQKAQAQTKQTEVAVSNVKENLKKVLSAFKEKNLGQIKKVFEDNKPILENLRGTLKESGQALSSSLRSIQDNNFQIHDELSTMLLDIKSSPDIKILKSKFNKLSIDNDFKLSSAFEQLGKKLNTIDEKYNPLTEGLQKIQSITRGDQLDLSFISAEIDLLKISDIESKLSNASGQLEKFVQGSLFTDLQNQIQNKLNFKNIFNSSKADDIVKSLRVRNLLGDNPAEKLGLETAFEQLGLDKAFSAFNGSLNFNVNDLVQESGFDNLTDLLNSRGADDLIKTFQSKLNSSVNKTLNSGIDFQGLVNENLSNAQEQLSNIFKTGIVSETLNEVSSSASQLQTKMVNIFDDPNIKKSIDSAVAQIPEFTDSLSELSASGLEKLADETTFGLNKAVEFINSDQAKTELTGVLDNMSTSLDSSLGEFDKFTKDLSKNVTSVLDQKRIKSLSSQLSSSVADFSKVVENVKIDGKLPDVEKLSKKLKFNADKLLKQVNVSELTGELKTNLEKVAKELKYTTDTFKENFDDGIFDDLKNQSSDLISGFKDKFKGFGSIVSKATNLETKLGSLDKVVDELSSTVNSDLFKEQISSLQKSVTNLAQTAAPQIPGLLDNLNDVTDSLINDASSSLLGEVGNLTETLKSQMNNFTIDLDPSEFAQRIGLDLNKLSKLDKDTLDIERIKDITGVNISEFVGGSLDVAKDLVENLKGAINPSALIRGSIGSLSSAISENVTPLTQKRSSKKLEERDYEKEIEEKPSKKTKSSNFIFYENSRGWNFVTLDQLILADKKLFKDGGKVQEFFFFDRTSTDQVAKDPQGHPIHEHQKIKEFKFTRQMDNEENLRKGLFNHTTLSFDPITRIRKVETFIYERDLDQIAHIDPTEFSSVITPASTYNEQRTNNTNTRNSESPNRELVISNIGEEYGDPNGKFVSASLFDPQLRNPSTKHEWKHLEHASKVQFNNIVLEIDISGNTDLEIGDLIKINIPTENFNRDRVNELDRLFGDTNKGAFFVVSQLRHVFTAKNSNFSTIVQCVKDVNYTTLPRR